MRAAVYFSNQDIRIEERPQPEIGPGELLLRIRASGICGSDVMEWYRKAKAPCVLGHEVAGVVEQAGDLVTRFKPGDRIVATHHVPCNRCRYCLTDRHSVCERLQTTNFDPGGFAEFVRIPALQVDRGTFVLPPNVSFEAGSFVEPLACVLRGLRLSGLRPGDRVAVLGSGISGLLQILAARALGAGSIVATDISEYRLAAALRAGADAAIPAPREGVEELFRANGGESFDRVLVCTGARPAMLQALQCVDRGGSVLYFAPLDPDRTLEIPANELWRRCITIVHSYAGPPAEMQAAIELLEHGRIDVEPLITHRFGLDGTGEGFRLTAEAGESLKVIIDPGS